MRGNASLAARKSSGRVGKLFGVARAAYAVILFLSLAAPATQNKSAPQPTQTKSAQASATSGAQVSGVGVSPVSVTQVSFKQLAKQAASAAQSEGPARLLAIHPPLSIPDSPAQNPPGSKRPKTSSSSAPPARDDTTGGPAAPSPSPSQSFLAQEDGPKAGNISGGIIPDT